MVSIKKREKKSDDFYIWNVHENVQPNCAIGLSSSDVYRPADQHFLKIAFLDSGTAKRVFSSKFLSQFFLK